MSLAVLLMALAAQENQGHVTPALCSLTYILVLTCTCEKVDGIAKSCHSQDILVLTGLNAFQEENNESS